MTICVNESAGFGENPVSAASVPTSDSRVGELGNAARLSEGGATAGFVVESAGDDSGFEPEPEPEGEGDAAVPFGFVVVAFLPDEAVFKSDGDEEPTDAV